MDIDWMRALCLVLWACCIELCGIADYNTFPYWMGVLASVFFWAVITTKDE